MPLDFSLLGPPPRINSPFAGLADMMAQREAAAGQREYRQGMAEKRRAEAEQTRQEAAAAAQVRSLFSRPNQPPTPDELSAIIGPEASTKVFEGFEALKKAQWENQDVARASVASILGAIEKVPAPLRPGWYAGARQTLIQQGKLKPEDAPEEYSPEFVQNALHAALSPKEQIDLAKPPADYTLGDSRISGATNQPIATAPPKPEKVTYNAPQTLMVNGRRSAVRAGSDGRMYDMNLKPIAAEAIAPEPRVEAQGPQPGYQWVNRGGEEVYTNRTEKGDRPAHARVKPTEDERKTAGFHGQMSAAITILDELEGGLTEKELYQIQTLPQEKLIGAINRGQLSEGAKRYLRAFEQFTESRLRPVSGAAIADSEYERDRRTYAKQYAETPKLAEDRANARKGALDALKTRAGVALDESKTAGGSGTVDMVAPDGRALKVPASDVDRMLSLGAKRKGA